MRIVTKATYYVCLIEPPGKQCHHAVRIQEHKEKPKGLEVEVETIRLLLERLVEEPKVGAAEGRQVDQYLTDGSLVRGPIDIMRMVLEDGRGVSEDAALMEEEEEGPEEDKSLPTDQELGPATLCP